MNLNANKDGETGKRKLLPPLRHGRGAIARGSVFQKRTEVDAEKAGPMVELQGAGLNLPSIEEQTVAKKERMNLTQLFPQFFKRLRHEAPSLTDLTMTGTSAATHQLPPLERTLSEQKIADFAMCFTTENDNHELPDMVAALDEALGAVIHCHAIGIPLEIAQSDLIYGRVARPVFHCDKCLRIWMETGTVPAHCEMPKRKAKGPKIVLNKEAARFVKKLCKTRKDTKDKATVMSELKEQLKFLFKKYKSQRKKGKKLKVKKRNAEEIKKRKKKRRARRRQNADDYSDDSEWETDSNDDPHAVSMIKITDREGNNETVVKRKGDDDLASHSYEYNYYNDDDDWSSDDERYYIAGKSTTNTGSYDEMLRNIIDDCALEGARSVTSVSSARSVVESRTRLTMSPLPAVIQKPDGQRVIVQTSPRIISGDSAISVLNERRSSLPRTGSIERPLAVQEAQAAAKKTPRKLPPLDDQDFAARSDRSRSGSLASFPSGEVLEKAAGVNRPRVAKEKRGLGKQEKSSTSLAGKREETAQDKKNTRKRPTEKKKAGESRPDTENRDEHEQGGKKKRQGQRKDTDESQHLPTLKSLPSVEQATHTAPKPRALKQRKEVVKRPGQQASVYNSRLMAKLESENTLVRSSVAVAASAKITPSHMEVDESSDVTEPAQPDQQAIPEEQKPETKLETTKDVPKFLRQTKGTLDTFPTPKDPPSAVAKPIATVKPMVKKKETPEKTPTPTTVPQPATEQNPTVMESITQLINKKQQALILPDLNGVSVLSFSGARFSFFSVPQQYTQPPQRRQPDAERRARVQRDIEKAKERMNKAKKIREMENASRRIYRKIQNKDKIRSYVKKAPLESETKQKQTKNPESEEAEAASEQPSTEQLEETAEEEGLVPMDPEAFKMQLDTQQRFRPELQQIRASFSQEKPDTQS